MKKKWARKIRHLFTCFYPSIQLERQEHLHINTNELQLVIIRRTRPDNTPHTTVWVMGIHGSILHKLFKWDNTLTKLGAQYCVQMKQYNQYLVVGNPANLKKLCRQLGVRKIILMHIYLPL